MAGGKETPRQKMIGMMYLVLTALLALNVSKDVLDSFVMVNDGLEQTNVNFTKKVDLSYFLFERQKEMNPVKVGPFFDKAMIVKAESDSLVNFIKRSKAEMISRVDGIPLAMADTLKLIDLKSKDNYSASSLYWVKEGGGEGGNVGGEGTRARILRDKIRKFKEVLLGVLPEKDLERIKIGLDTEGPFYEKGDEKSWEVVTFDRVIPVACVTNLNRLITEVRNAEFDVVNLLYGSISAEDFKFDQIDAKVVPNSNIVMLGDHYEAQIFVAAYDSKQNPEIIVNGSAIQVQNGIGVYKAPANSEGAKSFKGVINVTSPSGEIKPYPFENEYVVQRPSVTVSADKMNVFYIGVENPVSISVPGVADDKIKPSISAGGQLIPQGKGKYIVKIAQGTREAKISVNAMLDGGSKPMGSAIFRVRTVPSPIPYIANKKEGLASKEELLVAGNIIPRMENFDFDLRFEIQSFSMVTIVGGDVREFTAKGSRLTNEMRSALERSTRGQRITFESIVAKGPDGSTRGLPAINLKIQ